MEIELKLLGDGAHLQKVRESALVTSVATEQAECKHLINVYFDTPELDLLRAGMALRVRHIDGKHLQTLKVAGEVKGGLHQNEEWEMEIPGTRPDLAVLRKAMGRKSPHGSIIATPGLQEGLEPLFTTRFNRTLRNLRLATGEEIEMAVDQGTIECKAHSQAISEVELELKSGNPVRLYSFALSLLEEIPLQIGTRNKAERGYAMAIPVPRQAVKAAPLALQASMTVEEAFEAAVANCMKQVQANMEGVIHGTDPESVHQMRVGLRRLRSALDLFDAAIECPAFLRDEWKWLAGRLGAARDWEVLAGSTLDGWKNRMPADIDIGALRKAAMDSAAANRILAAEAVQSVRHTRLQLQFAEWMMNKGWRALAPAGGVPDISLPLEKFARQVLRHRQQRLNKRGRHLDQRAPETRHRLRIACKKMRYAMEFFGSLYPRSSVKKYLASLSGMQDELGRLNDAAVALRLLTQLQAASQPGIVSTAFVRGFLHAQVYGDNKHLPELWEAFRKIPAPYKA